MPKVFQLRCRVKKSRGIINFQDAEKILIMRAIHQVPPRFLSTQKCGRKRTKNRLNDD